MTQYVAVAEQSEEDKKWMREALEMAKEAFEAAEVPVGSVFVRNGEVIAKARNRTNELMNVSLDTTTLEFVQSAYIPSPLE